MKVLSKLIFCITLIFGANYVQGAEPNNNTDANNDGQLTAFQIEASDCSGEEPVIIENHVQTISEAGIASSNFTVAPSIGLVQAADDFRVPIGGYEIKGMNAYGTSPASASIIGANWVVEFYRNASGAPGTLVGSYSTASGSLTTVLGGIPYYYNPEFVFATPMSLSYGNYWVSVYHDGMGDLSTGIDRWQWRPASAGTGGIGNGVVLDHSNIFGVGATSWTVVSDLGLDPIDFAFTFYACPVDNPLAGIPTLGEWGIIIMSLLVLSLGTAILFRRKEMKILEM